MRENPVIFCENPKKYEAADGFCTPFAASYDIEKGEGKCWYDHQVSHLMILLYKLREECQRVFSEFHEMFTVIKKINRFMYFMYKKLRK